MPVLVEQGRPAREGGVEIAVIAVNYKSEQAAAHLLDDALRVAQTECKLTVVIADNGPSASALDALREKYRRHPAVRFETMPRNLGYFGAAHQVLHNLFPDRLPDWIIVSNTDIRLPQQDVFDRLARVPAGPAVIAPRIVSSRTGCDQNPFHRNRPSAFRMYVNRIIPRLPLLFWLLQVQFGIKRQIERLRRIEQVGTLPEPSTIYAPHGAFIIFNKCYFERGGTLNAGAFLFAEEKFVAETCMRLGLEVRYDPSLEVLHDEHVSTAHNPAVPRFQAAAADYLYQEFFQGERNPGAREPQPPEMRTRS